MAVTWRKPDNIVKQKKIKPSVKKKNKAQQGSDEAKTNGVAIEPTKSTKRKRDDAEEANGSEPLKVKKAKKSKKTAEIEEHVVAPQADAQAVNGDVPAADLSLQDLAFVDTQGSKASAEQEATESKEKKAKVKKPKLLPKRDRKELKRLKKLGLMKEHAEYFAKASAPVVKEDTRKVRKERRRLQKKGLHDELAVFEKKVAEDKLAKATALELEQAAIDVQSESQPETKAVDAPEVVEKSDAAEEESVSLVEPQKRTKKPKKKSKPEVAPADAVPSTINAEQTTANGASEEAETTTTRKREPLGDAVVPQKEHRFIVFIGNLPFSATKEQVQKHFKAVHPVDVRLMTDKATGKFKGFGFIEFDRYDYMNSCLQKYHHTHFAQGTPDSRRINVELTVGGGGAKEERKAKIKEKNTKLRHEQYRRREKVKDEEYRQKNEDKAAAVVDKTKAKTRPEGAAQEHAARDGIHPSRLGQVKK